MKETEEEGLRITQFCSRDAMIYDLKRISGRLTLRVTGREGRRRDGGVAHRGGHEQLTRREFRGGGDARRRAASRRPGLVQEAPGHNPPVFDWEIVARAFGRRPSDLKEVTPRGRW
jgi:hypothetical protein